MKKLLVLLAAAALLVGLAACGAPAKTDAPGGEPPEAAAFRNNPAEPVPTGEAAGEETPGEEDSFLAGLFTGPVTASGSCTDGLDWHFSDGTLAITGKGALPEYFPDDTLPWLEYVDQVRRVVVMEGCTEIGNGNFQNLPLLESVVLPDSVATIGVYAFARDKQLTQVDLGGGVEVLRGGAFQSCEALSSIDLPQVDW